MPPSLSRRAFLKAGLATAAATTALPAATRAVTPPRTVDPKAELCTVLDISKCVACHECVERCRQINGQPILDLGESALLGPQAPDRPAKFPRPKKPFPTMHPTSRVRVQDWSIRKRRAITSRLTPYNWLYVDTLDVPAFEVDGDERDEINIPRRCMHCQDPPCVKMCPFGAAEQKTNGIVRIDPAVCMGGNKCKLDCPWHVPQRQTGVGLYRHLLPNFAGNGVMYKCDRCYDRVAQGILPGCIEACEYGVQTIGPRREMVALAHRLARGFAHKSKPPHQGFRDFIYGELENGGTNTIYVSPAPLRHLMAAAEKQNQKRLRRLLARLPKHKHPNPPLPDGPAKIGAILGRPHLRRVGHKMARANNLTWALLVAPLVGAAAAVFGFLASGRKTGRDQGGRHG
ncbi:MAG: 4Fe-4S dicluster domain-containing protein [Proteobacteria bacterium]|nr:4Fe-4S dicluster domain-containing protein [Pseudomonadota bacterium]